ncbi:MAG: TrkH family potassium uptake protein [Oscillospiraceae bacterium]|nr:TrkH family potassium uptake protein [Oscillospiraceae bacterium]
MTTEKATSRLLPICYYIGLIILSLGALQLLPAATSAAFAEWRICAVFVFSASCALLLGSGMAWFGHRDKGAKLSFAQGMVVASGAWLLSTLLCAVPYYLSGNYLSYLDGCFGVMSGLTTTGVCLIQDMDHLSNGVNMWRHLLTFVGGQGMVVLALTFLRKNEGGAYKMYVGEAKDEKLFPNAVSTARGIWGISLLYLVVGTAVLTAAVSAAGVPAPRSLLHGMWIYMSAWSTGGFAPMSQNILYYHSLFVEVASTVFFIVGSFNFALHYAVLSGKRRELRRNIETVTFSVSATVLMLVTLTGLIQNNVYPSVISLFRKGVYQLLSGHTTTGFMTVYAKQFYYEWGDIALFAMMIAMLVGGSACSTAGGFKAMRVGILFQSIRAEVRRTLLPDSRVSEQKIHHIRDLTLTDAMVKSASLIVLLYILTFAVGTLAGMYAGFPLTMAAFECASVTGNVGLSIGVTGPAMPEYLKLLYIVIMWLGRLEFMSVLTLAAYIIRKVQKKCD